jgi:subtilisin family serine protease
VDALLATALLTGAAAHSPTADVATQIVVDLRDDVTDADVLALEDRLDGLDLRLNSIHAEDERLYIADLPPEKQPAVLQRLRRDDRVEYAEPNHIYRLIEDPAAQRGGRVGGLRGPQPLREGGPQRPAPVPVNDPFFEKQWSFQMIGAPEAWRHARGEGVVVAVIDTGVAYADRGRFRRVEDLSDDGFVTGYDFIKDSNQPSDDHGHGTHVAGTIAQATNNGLGVAGIAPKAKIMPLKVLSRTGRGTAGDIADAIRFAADEGAHVMNLSLGGGPRSMVMESAVRYAAKKGVLVVCAAGNGGRARVEYPAAYPGAFAVSSVGPDRKLAFYSSYGQQVAVTAPGGNKQFGEAGGILQNTITPTQVDQTNLYLSYQGTSMAAPHVAGVAALVMGVGVRDVDSVKRILTSSALDLGPEGWDERYGHGLLTAAGAVNAAQKEMAARRRAMAFHGGGTRAESPPAGLAEIAARHEAFARHHAAMVQAHPNMDCPHAKGTQARVVARRPVRARVNPLLWSMLPVLLAVAGLLHIRFMRPVLMVLAGMWSLVLLFGALHPGLDVVWIPGAAGWADRLWLLAHGAALMMLVMRLAQLVYGRTRSEAYPERA